MRNVLCLGMIACVILAGETVYGGKAAAPQRFFVGNTLFESVFTPNPADPHILNCYLGYQGEYIYLQGGSGYYLINLAGKKRLVFGFGGKVTAQLSGVQESFTLPTRGFNGQFGGFFHGRITEKLRTSLNYTHISSHMSDAPSNKDIAPTDFWGVRYSREFAELTASYQVVPALRLYLGGGKILNATPLECEDKGFGTLGFVSKIGPIHLVSHAVWSEEYAEKDKLETYSEVGFESKGTGMDVFRIALVHSLSHDPIGKFAVYKHEKAKETVGVKITFDR